MTKKMRRLTEQKALEKESEGEIVEKIPDSEEEEVVIEEEEIIEEDIDWKAIAEAKQLEIDRVKKDRRDSRKIESESPKNLSKAEVLVINSFRDEAFQDFLGKHPKYKEDDVLWSKFLDEYKDRVSEVESANRKGLPVTKRIFTERLNSIHSLISGSDEAREEGKASILRATSKAEIYSSAATTGRKIEPKKGNTRERILPSKSTGFQSWIPKKNK